MGRLIISAKCSDLCYVEFISDDGNISLIKDGYVPRNIGIGGGDYLELTIDTNTGKVVGFEENVSEEDIINGLNT